MKREAGSTRLQHACRARGPHPQRHGRFLSSLTIGRIGGPYFSIADSADRTGQGTFLCNWSGRRDLNPRPLGPEPSALPGCATPRQLIADFGSRIADWKQPFPKTSWDTSNWQGTGQGARQGFCISRGSPGTPARRECPCRRTASTWRERPVSRSAARKHPFACAALPQSAP